MTNREKYAKEILDIACARGDIAFDKRTMKVMNCEDLYCTDCLFDDFYQCCEEKLAEWAESEYIEQPKISRKDRAFLDYLKDYKYMARDKNGDLYAYTTIPTKASTYWENADFKNLTKLDIYFPMVKWSDDEPWKIEDLKELEVVNEYIKKLNH